MKQNITKRIMRHSQTDLIIDHSLCSSDKVNKQNSCKENSDINQNHIVDALYVLDRTVTDD